MILLFSLALFLSSSLLFMVEPMFAKMVLPLLGGTPAVWNTCILFFQLTLLAGYAYTHFATTRLSPRIQTPSHLVLVMIPLVCLPIAIHAGWTPPREGNPIVWLLSLLLVCVGLPFFVLSTSATIIQKWFSRTDHPAAGDPYFLYVASNAGSVFGLIGYIILFEPNFTLAQQSRIWSAGYIALILLTAACAMWAVRARHSANIPSHAAREEATTAKPQVITLRRRLRWIALAFVPSSLMLGVTTFFTTDVASVPLLWVVPLTIYLVTFILAFSRRSLTPHQTFARLLPMLVLAELIVLYAASLPLPWIPALHLITFFVAAAVFHRELANDRPDARHLTEFYLMLSIGGALGGVLNALVAPLVFNAVWEYPLALALACALCPRFNKLRSDRFRPIDIVVAACVGIVGFAVLYAIQANTPRSAPLVEPALGLVAMLCYLLVERPARFGLGLTASLLAIFFTIGGAGEVVHQERSFFGVLRIQDNRIAHNRALMHGTTVHGAQSLIAELRNEPLLYFHRTGPIGMVFAALDDTSAVNNVAIIGLGAGSIASYADKGQSFMFYEIDPAVERIASDPRHFTYLSDSRRKGADVHVVLGDARLTIADAPAHGYGLIIIDAFSSDSIPMHLVTREAFALYLSKLQPHGMIAAHITNRYLDLEAPLARLADEAGLAAMICRDNQTAGEKWPEGRKRSTWMVLARSREDLRALSQNPKWKPAAVRPGMRVWTDDFSNIISVVKWRQ